MPIRTLTATDAPAYRALRLEMLTHDPSAFGSSAEEFRERSPESVAAQLTPTDTRFTLGAWEGSNLLGTATLAREDGLKTRHKAFVYGVYVTPAARGQGLAHALMTGLMERAREQNISTLMLAVAEPQTAARTLYTRLGFTPYGTEPDALRVNGQSITEFHLRREL